MAEPAQDLDDMLELDVSHLVTEDDEPVDNFFQDKQATILIEALRVSWEQGRPFISAADVGLFYAINQPAIVPDVLLSIGIEPPEDFHSKEKRSYFMWNFGKPPEVVVEIVSNRKGGEDTTKLERYASVKVPYCVIYDPELLLSNRELRIFQLSGASYVEKVDRFFPELGLGLTIWDGLFDGWNARWLRWVDEKSELLAIGTEERERADGESRRANEASQRADEEKRRADEEQRRADEEKRRADELEAKLRALGVEP